MLPDLVFLMKLSQRAGMIDSPRALEHFTHSENQLHVLTKTVSKDMIRISHGNHRKKSLLVTDEFKYYFTLVVEMINFGKGWIGSRVS